MTSGKPYPSAADILLVEDHGDLRVLLAEALGMAGYIVATASNGQTALAYLQDHDAPGLIILDLIMPVMDGWAFLQTQRREPGLSDIPVITLSGFEAGGPPDPGETVAARLAKPVDLDHLLLTVQTHRSARPAGSEERDQPPHHAP